MFKKIIDFTKREKVRRILYNILTILCTILFEMVLLLGVITLISLNFFNQPTVALFKEINTTTIALWCALFLGIGVGVIAFAKPHKESFLTSIENTISLLLMNTSLLTIIVSFFMPTGKATTESIKSALQMTNLTFYLSSGLVILSAISALYHNSDYFKRNNWYIFTTLAPFILYGGALYRKHEIFNNYLDKIGLTPKFMTRVFKESQKLVGVKQADIVLINEYIPFLLEGCVLLLVIYIALEGGRGVVWTFQKIKRRKKEN